MEDSTQAIDIIDCHQHLWDLSVVKTTWLTSGFFLAKDHVTKDYIEAIEGHGNIKGVYMEVDVISEDKEKEVDYIIALCEDKDAPTIAAIIGGDPSKPEFEEYFNKYKSNKYIKGIRHALHNMETPKGYCLEEEFVKGVQMIGKNGWCFNICMRPGELEDAVKLVEQCPDTAFVLDHCGMAHP
jgi:L-fuconolactonase